MQLEQGCVVRSIAGRDADRFYVILRTEEGFAWIADGKVRPLERPKKKNAKHLRPTKTRIPLETIVTNNQLKRFLKGFGPDEAAT
ncbi:MAG: KOW domain-containing RNA-binding protein [Oscillospiraceae bacterium]|nr:KOW domain-containing RNA-binding protein [Oscillospiraceae bacterium]